MEEKQIRASYYRNFIFGVEDSLVSTVGLLSGIAIAEVGSSTILLTGIILIFVEAFSMAAGSFLSEHSSEGYIRRAQAPLSRSLIAGSIMFISYFLSGFIPLLPYIYFAGTTALWVSIGVTLAALFILGIIAARISKINLWHEALKMLLVGGVAAGLGIVIGRFAQFV